MYNKVKQAKTNPPIILTPPCICPCAMQRAKKGQQKVPTSKLLLNALYKLQKSFEFYFVKAKFKFRMGFERMTRKYFIFESPLAI